MGRTCENGKSPCVCTSTLLNGSVVFSAPDSEKDSCGGIVQITPLVFKTLVLTSTILKKLTKLHIRILSYTLVAAFFM